MQSIGIADCNGEQRRPSTKQLDWYNSIELNDDRIKSIICTYIVHIHVQSNETKLFSSTYSRLPLSRTRLFRIPLISKWKSGPCFNTDIYQQAIKYCGKEEKLLLRSNFSSFPQYFQNVSNLGVRLHSHSVKGGCSINCFPESANLICRSTDISNCFIESLGVRDNESRLYCNFSSDAEINRLVSSTLM